MDDFPLRVLGRLLIRRQGNLAGATAVSGLAAKAEGLILADGHDILLDELVDIVTLLARKVASVGV